ncbi:MAG: hypothetical protein RI637_13005, partial [Acidimicrobiia bacterium]|nr:hypothetical protein [Acidimicrobiia bacterium]
MKTLVVPASRARQRRRGSPISSERRRRDQTGWLVKDGVRFTQTRFLSVGEVERMAEAIASTVASSASAGSGGVKGALGTPP